MNSISKLCILTTLFFISFTSKAYYYEVSGFVLDQNNDPIPYANVYVKEADIGTTTDIEGKYHFELQEGTYEIIFSMLGFEKKHIQVTLTSDIVRNVYLQNDVTEIETMEVHIKKRKDPAYAIMKNVIANKNKYIKQYNSSMCNVYLKAGEVSEKKEVKKKNKINLSLDNTAEDTIQKPIVLPQKSFVEAQIERNWQYPNQVKEVVNAYEQRGSIEYLYNLNTVENDFNFYKNMLNINGLTESPIISPLSRTSFVVYKFKFIESYIENEKLIHRIQVIPRNSGSVLFDGILEIVDFDYSIKKLSLHLKKGSTNLFDDFTIKQDFFKQDSLWLLESEKFNYSTKVGKTIFNGETKLFFTNWQINPVFKKRFFSNELGVVTEEAYEKDSTFWDEIRPEPLTKDEQQFIEYTDSIKEAHESEAYLDSMQAIANKVTLRKLFIDGLAYINHKKEKSFYFSSIAGMVNPFQVGGFRIGYWMSYRKKFKKKRVISVFAYPNFGFRNKDLKGSGSFYWKYNPFREGYLSIRGAREFDMINPYDAYINVLRRTNYFQNDRLSVANSIELFNGFYSYASFNFSLRSSISHYKIGTFTDGWFDDNDFQNFVLHNAFYTNIGFYYTPKQKYIRQPHEKIVLGSKYPTFGVQYRKGWENILRSSINFNFIEFYARQKIKFGTAGTSQYKIKAGKFLTQDSVSLVDYKYQRMGDPYIYTDPLSTFQLLERTFPTFDWFLEGHYIHHFNGAIINKFPLIKKTRIRLVGGGSILFAKDNGYRHIEVFAGAERIFKVWRERFRLGWYVATAESNFTKPRATFKVSFEYFNKQNQSWGF